MATETREVVDVFGDEGVDPTPQEPQQQTQQPQKTQEPAKQEPAEPAEPKQNNDVREAVAAAFKEFAPKPQAAPVQEMSEADKRKLWAIFDPEEADPKFFHDFFGLGEDVDPATLARKKELWAKFQTGMMRQAVTAAYNMLNARAAEFDQRLAPLQEHYTQQRAGEVKRRFHESYPVLAEKRFEKLLKLSATALKDQEFDSEENYFKALAEHAADTIKATGIEFDLGAPQQTKPTPGTAPKTPRSRVGGTGGAGSGSAVAPATSSRDDAASLF